MRILKYLGILIIGVVISLILMDYAYTQYKWRYPRVPIGTCLEDKDIKRVVQVDSGEFWDWKFGYRQHAAIILKGATLSQDLTYLLIDPADPSHVKVECPPPGAKDPNAPTFSFSPKTN